MNTNNYLVDSHCHPHFPPLGADIAALMDDMRRHDVGGALAVATVGGECAAVAALARQHPHCFAAACGIHPLAADDEKDAPEVIAEYCRDEQVLAVGETGLDFFRGKEKEQLQRRRFQAHIEAAKLLGKPLIIHTRNSLPEVLAVLRAENAREVGGVLHCYTGDKTQARAGLDINFMLSFSAIIAFKNSGDIQAAAKFVAADSYLVETDAPYLAPPPHRGKTNTPGYVRYVAAAVAAVRGVCAAQVAAETTDNFFRLFKPRRAFMNPPSAAQTPRRV